MNKILQLLYGSILIYLSAYFVFFYDFGQANLNATPIKETIEVEASESQIIPSIASWYDYKLVGKIGIVCNRFSEDCYTETVATAASRDYPRYSKVEVCRTDNTKCIIVKITDYIEHPLRDIDLSSYAFSQLANLKTGIIKVNTKLIK